MADNRTATLDYNADMNGWPPRGHLVHLDPPLRRFNVETGDAVLHPDVVVVVKEADRYGTQGSGVDVFACQPDGQVPTDTDTMIPLARMDLKPVHSALIELGYQPTN